MPRSSWSATLTCKTSCRTRSITTCSSRCPTFLQVEAFIDRIHCYTPGWEIPKIKPDSMSQDYGFITDYFCRDHARVAPPGRAGAVEGPLPVGGYVGGRAAASRAATCEASRRRFPACLKLMYPHGEVNDEQLGELLSLGHRRAAAGPQSASLDGPRRIRPACPVGQAHPIRRVNRADTGRRQPRAARHPAQQTHGWRSDRPGRHRRRPGLHPQLRGPGVEGHRPDRQPGVHAAGDEGKRGGSGPVHPGECQVPQSARPTGRRTRTWRCWRR